MQSRHLNQEVWLWVSVHKDCNTRPHRLPQGLSVDTQSKVDQGPHVAAFDLSFGLKADQWSTVLQGGFMLLVSAEGKCLPNYRLSS